MISSYVAKSVPRKCICISWGRIWQGLTIFTKSYTYEGYGDTTGDVAEVENGVSKFEDSRFGLL